MGLTSATTSCLSAEPHDDAIRDPQTHYFGCIEIRDRERFLDPENVIWKKEVEHQKKKLMRAGWEKDNEEGRPILEEQALTNAKAIQKRWGSSFRKELRRIDFLRNTLAKDDLDMHLVQEVDKCREEWKKLPKRRANIRNNTNAQSSPEAPQSQDSALYELEKDISVGIIHFKDRKPFNDENENENKLIWGKFPDQKIRVKDLLYGEHNLLHKDRVADEPNTIRYFHIPSNNMEVSAVLIMLFMLLSA
jgi:hypothetical protein